MKDRHLAENFRSPGSASEPTDALIGLRLKIFEESRLDSGSKWHFLDEAHATSVSTVYRARSFSNELATASGPIDAG
jgi:hypothetical protein